MARLEHVGIAVAEEVDVLRVLADLLGEHVYATEMLKDDGIRTHFVSGSSAKIELLERIGENSAVASFLERRGTGLHHLAFEVDDIHSMFNRAREAGYDPIDPAPRPGADGKLIFFLHPRQTAGLLFEFCQAQSSPYKSMATADLTGVRHIRAATGSGSATPLLYVFDDTPGVDPERLAARLLPGRSLYAVEAGPTADFDALFKRLSVDRLHLAADGSPSAALLQYIEDDRVHSIVLIDPDDDILGVTDPTGSIWARLFDTPINILILLRDDADELRRAAALRDVGSNLTLAAISHPDLRAALFAAYLR